jgi:hypothetical protein
MPGNGAAARAFTPSGSNYGPTGSVQIAQATIPIPQDMIVSGANTNSTNAIVWTVWNDIYTSTISVTSTPTQTLLTSTMPTITSNAVWNAWNLQLNSVTQALTSHIGQPITSATTASINTTIWTNWNSALTNRHATAEQVAQAQRHAREQQARQAEQTRAQAVVQAERGLAEKRAEKLLQETLSAKQREELATKGFFTLETIAASGERRIYRIKRGRSANVEQVDVNGNRIKRLCIHPVAPVPDADTMVAQKLMLETGEEEFLRIANHS